MLKSVKKEERGSPSPKKTKPNKVSFTKDTVQKESVFNPVKRSKSIKNGLDSLGDRKENDKQTKGKKSKYDECFSKNLSKEPKKKLKS